MVNPRTERALGYVRVSTQRQADGGISIDNQENRLAEHYRARVVELVDIYKDGGLSGTTDNRPGLQALFEHAMRPGSGITEIGVYSFSRLFRDHYLLEHYRRKLKRAGVRIVAITQEVGQAPKATSSARCFPTSTSTSHVRPPTQRTRRADLEQEILLVERQVSAADRRVTPAAVARLGDVIACKLRSDELALRQGYARRFIAKVVVAPDVITISGPTKALELAVSGDPEQLAPAVPSSARKWCGREDSNFHGLSPTTTSTLRVYQFRHDRTSTGRK